MKNKITEKEEEVVVNMIDLQTDKKVKRAICKINAFKNGSTSWELGNESEQRKSLEKWIEERANSQHETFLKLIS